MPPKPHMGTLAYAVVIILVVLIAYHLLLHRK